MMATRWTKFGSFDYSLVLYCNPTRINLGLHHQKE